RFIVAWLITEARVTRRLEEGPPDSAAVARRFGDAPVVGPLRKGAPEPPLPEAPRVRVEIPASIQEVKTEDPDLARAYRASTRRAFEHYLGQGWKIEDYYRDPGDPGRCYYGVTAP